MTGEAVAGVVRAILAALGGYLVGKGVIDNETANNLAGAAVVIVTGVWSILNKKKLTQG